MIEPIASAPLTSSQLIYLETILPTIADFLRPGVQFYLLQYLGSDYVQTIKERQPWTAQAALRIMARCYCSVFSDVFKPSRGLTFIEQMLKVVNSVSKKRVITVGELWTFFNAAEIVVIVLNQELDGKNGNAHINKVEVIRDMGRKFLDTVEGVVADQAIHYTPPR